MIIDRLENAATYKALGDRLSTALNYLQSTNFAALQAGRHEIDGDNIFAMISEYETKSIEHEKLESHRRYIDIQYLVTGTELMGYLPLSGQQPSKAYDEAKDFMLYDEQPAMFVKAGEGMFIIFFPNDLHMPSIQDGPPAYVRKVVMKIRL